MFKRKTIIADVAPAQATDEKFVDLRNRAESGDVNAQFDLGLHYALGREGKHDYIGPDYAEAARWWRMAADQNDTRAITNLGFLYASRLLESPNGDNCTTSNVGCFYARGLRGGANNEFEAVEYWRRAASLDHPAAQFELAMWHFERSFIAKANDAESGNAHSIRERSPEEYRIAFDWIRVAAQNGHSEAQLWLGESFTESLCLPKGPIEAISWLREDDAEAIKWLRESARQEPRAAYRLAEIYASGKGANNNAAESIRWLIETAHSGYADANRAQQALGYMYACGEILPVDFKEAAKWWRKAAMRDRCELDFHSYYNRRGSASEAWVWLCEAASRGSESARTLLGFFPSVLRRLISEDKDKEERRKSIRQDKTIDECAKKSVGSTQSVVAQIDGEAFSFIVSRNLDRVLFYKLTADTAAFQFLQEREKQGDLDALFALGLLKYYRTFGEDDEEHDAQAAKWLLKAAEQGIASAFRILAEMYEWGSGVPKDKAASERWYRKAAEHGDAEAQFQIARQLDLIADSKWTSSDACNECDERGNRIRPPEYSQAIQWLHRAARQGHAQAQYELAEKIADETRFIDRWSRRKAEAFKLYRLAAEQGYAPAQYELGDLLRRADFPLRNNREAADWFLKAACQDYRPAQDALSWAYFKGRGVRHDGAEAANWLRCAHRERYY